MPTSKPKPILRKLRFTMRTMLVVTTVIALVIAWLNHNYHRAFQEAAFVEELRAEIAHLQTATDLKYKPFDKILKLTYDYQHDSSGNFLPNAKPRGPTWLREWLGEHLLDRVHTLEINTLEDSDLEDTPFYCSIRSPALAGIGKLKSLKKLALLAHLENDGLQALNQLGDLETLYIACPDSGLRLDSISKLNKLKHLETFGDVVAATQPLRFKLQSLAIGNTPFTWQWRCEIESLDVFGDLTALENLVLRRCTKIRDLDSLSNLPLKMLVVRDCPKLSDISGICDLPTLIELELSADWNRPMNGLDLNNGETFFPYVKRFSTEYLDFSNLEFLSKSEELESLSVTSPTVEDVRTLGQLKKLKHLSLAGPIEKIDVHLGSLENLVWFGRKMKDLNFLSNDNNHLRQVGLYGGHAPGVKNISCLRFATGLEVLYVAGLGIENIDAVSGIKTLKTVSIDDNPKLTDISGIAGSMGSLEGLALTENSKLTNLDVLQNNMPKLTKLKVNGNPNLEIPTAVTADLKRFKLLEIPNGKSIKTERWDRWIYSNSWEDHYYKSPGLIEAIKKHPEWPSG